ncbi:MAG: flagellar export protein FliJ [Oligoflexia bacterium]|nr:flagellar export protein FliJ [Oligoflexia bacterium]
MKKFKFRLDSVLRLREFEEYKEMIELGKINQEMKTMSDKISDIDSEISRAYEIQEKDMRQGSISASDLQIYGEWIDNYRALVDFMKKEHEKIQERYQEKLEDVVKKKNKVKMLKKLKAKALNEYRKDYNYDESNQIEDIVSMNFAYGYEYEQEDEKVSGISI